MKSYEARTEYFKNYYQTHKDTIISRQKENQKTKYVPTGRPRGRPRKVDVPVAAKTDVEAVLVAVAN